MFSTADRQRRHQEAIREEYRRAEEPRIQNLRATPQGVPPERRVVLRKEALYTKLPLELKFALHGKDVNVCLFGLAGAGKSNLNNCIAYAMKGNFFYGGRPVGAATANDAQYSTTSYRDKASSYLPSSPDNNLLFPQCDFYFRDTVGFTGHVPEINAILLGKFDTVDAWSRNAGTVDGIHRQAEMLRRQVDRKQRSTCVVLCISAEYIGNPADNAKDAIIKTIIETAKEGYEIEVKGSTRKMKMNVPVFICITKCDHLATNDDFKHQDLVYQDTHPKIADIFKKCQERFGVPQCQMFALGWLDQCNTIDWSHDTEDARALAVRHMIMSVTEAAQMRRDEIEQFEGSSPFTTTTAPEEHDEKNRRQQEQDASLVKFMNAFPKMSPEAILSVMQSGQPSDKIRQHLQFMHDEIVANNLRQTSSASSGPARDVYPGGAAAAASSPNNSSSKRSSNSVDDWRNNIQPPLNNNNNNNNNNQNDDDGYDNLPPSVSQVGGPTYKNNANTYNRYQGSIPPSQAMYSVADSQSSMKRLQELHDHFQEMFRVAGNRQNFIEVIRSFTCDNLCAFLESKNVPAPIVSLHHANSYNGQAFVDEDFVEDAFSDAEMNKFGINGVNLKTFVKIRKEALGLN